MTRNDRDNQDKYDVIQAREEFESTHRSMIVSPGLESALRKIFFDPTTTEQSKFDAVIYLFSEMEEYCVGLEEKVEKLEHDLGLTGVGDKSDN